MSSLNQYIAELNFFADNLHNIVIESGVKSSGAILSTLKQRLFNKGTDANNSLIGGGAYSKNYKEYKRGKGRRTSFVNLRMEGDYYDSMFVEARGTKGLFIDATDWKKSILAEQYSSWELLGLTEDETENLVAFRIDPEIQKTINKLPQTIDI